MVSTRRVEDYSKLPDLESATARTIALALHTFYPPYVAHRVRLCSQVLRVESLALAIEMLSLLAWNAK